MLTVTKDVFDAARAICANCREISAHASPIQCARSISRAFYNAGFDDEAKHWEQVASFVEDLAERDIASPVLIREGGSTSPVWPIWYDRSQEIPLPSDVQDEDIPF